MGEHIEFPSNGHTCNGYLARPSSGSAPGVVVIQEWWGLVPHIEQVCDRFAAEGFIALAPDLYHGKKTKEPDEAGKLLMALDLDRAAQDMKGAAGWLLGEGGADGDGVGIVGYCMGGALALYAGTVSETFSAIVAYYPAFPAIQKGKPDFHQVKGAVQGHFAEQDNDGNRQPVEDLERQLEEAGVPADFH